MDHPSVDHDCFYFFLSYSVKKKKRKKKVLQISMFERIDGERGNSNNRVDNKTSF